MATKAPTPYEAGASLLAPPRGMRDIVPPSSTALKRLRSKLMRVFSLHGYDRVTTPPFELADVISRGLDATDQSTLMRFVEPDTGEVAVLRPDVTPQVARIVATRLMDRPAPHRLCYEATVVRRVVHRARRRQQTFQAGIECIGVADVSADVEVLRVADRACHQVGLSSHQFELAHVNIARSVLARVPEAARQGLHDAMMQKDAATVEAILGDGGVNKRERARLASLTELYGDTSVLKTARRRFKKGPIADALRELSLAAELCEEAGFHGECTVDLGEVRGHGYYTGVSVTLLAPGPGEPIGTGGRYDDLLERYGAPQPATGFAFDVDNLSWALRAAGQTMLEDTPVRAVVNGPSGDADVLADALRLAGMPCARVATTTNKALAYAEAWSYDLVLSPSKQGQRLRATRVSDGTKGEFAAPVSTQEAPQEGPAAALTAELARFHRSEDAAGTRG